LHENSYQNFIQIHSNIHRIHVKGITSGKNKAKFVFFRFWPEAQNRSAYFGPAACKRPPAPSNRRPARCFHQIGQQALTWARALIVLARMGQKRPSWDPGQYRPLISIQRLSGKIAFTKKPSGSLEKP
jgi:hypothetical protein